MQYATILVLTLEVLIKNIMFFVWLSYWPCLFLSFWPCVWLLVNLLTIFLVACFDVVISTFIGVPQTLQEYYRNTGPQTLQEYWSSNITGILVLKHYRNTGPPQTLVLKQYRNTEYWSSNITGILFLKHYRNTGPQTLQEYYSSSITGILVLKHYSITNTGPQTLQEYWFSNIKGILNTGPQTIPIIPGPSLSSNILYACSSSNCISDGLQTIHDCWQGWAGLG